MIGAHYHLNGPGAHSRYCRAIRCPDPKRDEETFLAFLADLARDLGQRAVVFPTSDDYVRFLSKHREALEERFSLAVAPTSVIEVVVDKRRTYEAARRLLVPVPASGSPQNDASLLQLADEIPYPALIKPAMSHTGVIAIRGKAVKVDSGDELIEHYRQLDGSWASLMVQEMIPGRDDRLWTLGAYLNIHGRPLAVFSGRKLRQYPPHFGTCSLGESVWNIEVVKMGLRLLKGIGYTGPAQVEFKQDPRDGRLKLVEINARTWLWHPLASNEKVDLVYIAYLDMTGYPAPRRLLGKPGARWLSVIADAASARRYIRSGELSVAGWLRSWHGVEKLDLLSLRDPLPFVSALWSVIRHRATGTE